MKYKYFGFVLFLTLINCTKEVNVCSNVINGEIKIGKKTYTLISGFLGKPSPTTTGLQPHEIIFESLREDCITKDQFRFYFTVTSGQKLEGSFTGEDTNVYKDRKLTSFFHSSKTSGDKFTYYALEKPTIEGMIQIQNLTATVVHISDKEYKITLRAKEVKLKKDYFVYLKHKFE